jgi:glycerol-3-phosphate dehydrogenase
MSLRDNNVAKLHSEKPFDVLIVGSGINGAATAAALSSHGLTVAIIDKNDFGSYTSQQSSNLVWGGIKYLESFEFALVEKLCRSRNHLLDSYPSLIQEIRFFTSIEKGFRHFQTTLYLGTILYWVFGRFKTRMPRIFSRRAISIEEPVIKTDRLVGGFEYSDAYIVDNDARFTFNFVRKALDYGAIAANYVAARAAHRDAASGLWHVEAQDTRKGASFTIRAKVLINATGPYADEFSRLAGLSSDYNLVLSKGVHLLVRQLTPHKRVLTFFADDGRLFFVIPMGARSCIGTTDTRVETHPPLTTAEDRRFILDNINKRLKLDPPLTEADIIAERCGVRPLVTKKSSRTAHNAEWTTLSRKHVVEINREQHYLSILGGKLTDCVNVGYELIDAVRSLGLGTARHDISWYGEAPDKLKDEFFLQARLGRLDELTSPCSHEKLSLRLWRRYGLHAFDILEDIRQDPAMAEVIIQGTEYIRAELHHAAKWEMVTTLEDFLRRRSKIALIERTDTILNAPGLAEAAQILFGARADDEIAAYREKHLPAADPAPEAPRRALAST